MERGEGRAAVPGPGVRHRHRQAAWPRRSGCHRIRTRRGGRPRPAASATTKKGVLELADWCAQLAGARGGDGGDRATTGRGRSTGWRPRGSSACWPIAKQVKNLPGRPSGTRRIRGGWRRASSVARSPPASWPRRSSAIIRLHTRYRRDLTEERTRDKKRAERLLESAALKLSSVLADLHGVTGRDIMDHLIAGERNPKVLAQLARTAPAARSASWNRRWKARSSSPPSTPRC